MATDSLLSEFANLDIFPLNLHLSGLQAEGAAKLFTLTGERFRCRSLRCIEKDGLLQCQPRQGTCNLCTSRLCVLKSLDALKM